MPLATQFDPSVPAPAAWVARLIERLQALYGAKFAQQWEGISPARLNEIWGEELAGYAGDEIARGLLACRTRVFPPTLPEFLLLCRPGLAPDVAFQDAVAGMAARRRGEVGYWSHPAVYWAAVAVGPHDLLQCTYGTLRSRWERALSDQMAKGQWAPVPEPAPALPAPGQTLATREEAAAAMKRMGADKVLSQTGRNQRDWAHRIFAEQERKGGKRSSITVIAMARRALDLPTEVLP
jgi:hypothetical protein